VNWQLQPASPPNYGPRLSVRLLSDFGRFWEIEDSPAERHRLLTTLFEQIWQDAGVIVAVTPHAAFTRYFQALVGTAETQSELTGVQSGSDGTRTRDLRRDRPAL
jgi:hypothetical protein